MTHSTPYQIINTGLYIVAPYTAGVTEGAMTTAALAGDASDLAENGLSVSNAINTGFDVVPALPALSWLRYAPKFKRGVAEGVYQDAFN